uniref:Ovule protein n=1 Tax=Haemonchus placei TaxID=6290 RepID=A0A0N4WMW3_HAEPC
LILCRNCPLHARCGRSLLLPNLYSMSWRLSSIWFHSQLPIRSFSQRVGLSIYQTCAESSRE